MAVKIVYQDVAVGAADDASVTATQKESISDVSLIPYGGDTGAYATLEPSLWVLDGSVDIYDDEDVAYVSSVLSNEDGLFGDTNLYDSSTRVDGYYISNGGVPTTDATSSYSAAIPIEYGKTYTFSGISGKTGTNNKRCKWYTNDDAPSASNVISSPSAVSVSGIGVPYQITFTVTDNRAKFVRLSFNTADTDVAFVEGDSPPSIYSPTITIAFDDTYTSLGIFVSQFGDAYCNDLNIKWYNGSTQLASEDFAPDKLDYFCENTVENYDKVVITFNAMTHPYRRLRVNQILFGIIRTFEQDELRSGTANIIQQIDHTGREVAYNTLDWTLSSKDDVDFVFQQRQRMEAYDGQTLMGVFYVDDSDRVALRQYKISCKDAVGVLGDDPFPDAYYSNKNAYALAQEICGEFAVEMDAALQSKTVTGIIYQQTRRGALQQLCFAINAIADTSGTDKVKIFALDDSDPVILDETRLRPSGSVSKSSAVTAVTVTAHSYSTSGSGQGIKIGNRTYYDTTSSQTIVNPDVGDGEKPNVVEVSDCTLVSPTNLAEVAQHLYNGVVKRQTHNVSFRLHGELVGRYVQTITPWATDFTGFYIKGNIRLSSFALTQAEVIGDD